MATQRSGKKSGKSMPKGSADEVIDLLMEDHREVEQMFEEYESEKDDDEGAKMMRAQAICFELTLHATVEEEIFYPAAREALGEEGEDLLDEAAVEHASIKDLVAQLEEAEGDDELFDAKVKVLSEYVKHHVSEEEGELFRKLRGTDLDGEALAEQISQRKEELREQLDTEVTT